MRRLIARLLLAFAVVGATQLAWLHPLAHLDLQIAGYVDSAEDEHPFEPLHSQACDVCVGFAAAGAAAVSDGAALFVSAVQAPGAFAHLQSYVPFFTPAFRSQAPPLHS